MNSTSTFESTYRHSSKESIRQLRDQFLQLVSSCKTEVVKNTTDLTQTSREALAINVQASNMVRSAESLMTLLAKMKEVAIMNDFRERNQMTEARILEVNEQASAFDHVASTVCEEARQLLTELEDAWYQSKYKA